MKSSPSSGAAPSSSRPGFKWARAGSILLWYGVPALAVTLVLAYIGLAVAWRANPPAVPVLGGSMRPTLHAGDLAFVKGVDPTTLRKGDIIAFRVPKALQEKYDVPATYIHRIVRADHGQDGSAFRTKGDAVGGPDPFWTRDSNVVGQVIGAAPGGGYPILFFRSRQGQLFAGTAALVLLIYFLLGVLDQRREFAEMNVLTMAQIVDEARTLKETMERQTSSSRPPPSGAQGTAPPSQRSCSRGCHVLPPTAKFDPHNGERLPVVDAPALTTYDTPYVPVPSHLALVSYDPTLHPPAIDFAKLEQEIHRAVASSEDVQDTMRGLVGAISDYGEHLRSHTAVMQNLAASTGELHSAAAEMRQLLAALTQVVSALAEQRPGNDAT